MGLPFPNTAAAERTIRQAESLFSAAMALIETSGRLDLQGNGLLDFAGGRELARAPRTLPFSATRS
jgi:hypothetical protein